MAQNDFTPDWVSPPGDTMADILDERDLSLDEFAKRMGASIEHVNDLLHGRAMITVEIARRLEHVLGSTAAFWMVRESQYRKDIGRLQPEKLDPIEAHWLRELPLKDMVNFGWVRPVPKPVEKVGACLDFFDVPNIAQWRERYRKVLTMAAYRTSSSFESKPGAVATWLRRAEIQGTSITCEPWHAKRFQESLPKIRQLTRTKHPCLFIPKLTKYCADCGVAMVIVRAPTGCRASGATTFISPNKALLALSFRHLSDDHFWFTFFHEAGHLLLHNKKDLFLEGLTMVSTKEDREANEFAAQILIPNDLKTRLFALRPYSREVIKFARLARVSPGIVVGQLQHLGRINRNQLNYLKRRFTWGSD